MEPVLTQDELEAIYEAMQGDPVQQASIDDLALTNRHEFIVTTETKWTEAAEAMMSKIEGLLTGALARRIKVEVQRAEWVEDTGERGDLFDGETASPPPFDEGAVVSVVKFGETRLFLGIDGVLAHDFVERRTGASSDQDDNRQPSRNLTPLERRLLNGLVGDISRAAAAVSPRSANVSIDPIDAEEAWRKRPDGEMWIVVHLRLTQYPGPGVWFLGPAKIFIPAQEKTRQTLANHLQTARIVLSAELGKFRLNVSDLWQLNPGTLVPIESAVGDPIKILIGGIPKLEGEPLVSRGNIAVRLVGRAKGVN
ncbi:MAG: hypothetical protein GY854_28420 [Deltaproteobacteria bacterium]|nr:hypothetical protein [Deltaproteobacteria bacterium]